MSTTTTSLPRRCICATDVAVCADRRDLCERSQRGHAGRADASSCRREFLYQRQTDRRGGRPAAVWRRPGLGHERQGGRYPEHAALDRRARSKRTSSRRRITSTRSWGRGVPIFDSCARQVPSPAGLFCGAGTGDSSSRPIRGPRPSPSCKALNTSIHWLASYQFHAPANK